MNTRKAPEPAAPFIKICGLTTLADARVAAEAGADYLGFNFTNTSKRRVELVRLQEWWADLPANIKRVALFQDQSIAEITQVLQTFDMDVVQFHGAESAVFCTSFGLPYWKAIAMRNEHSFADAAKEHGGAAAFLLDTVITGKDGSQVSGGTGHVFDWSLWPAIARESATPLILAGGLSSANVAQAIKATQPWMVDVASGVESSPGVKSSEKIQQFCHEVRGVRESQ